MSARLWRATIVPPPPTHIRYAHYCQVQYMYTLVVRLSGGGGRRKSVCVPRGGGGGGSGWRVIVAPEMIGGSLCKPTHASHLFLHIAPISLLRCLKKANQTDQQTLSSPPQTTLLAHKMSWVEGGGGRKRVCEKWVPSSSLSRPNELAASFFGSWINDESAARALPNIFRSTTTNITTKKGGTKDQLPPLRWR